MTPNIKLYTDRLYLRPFSADDIEPHIAMMGEGAAIDFLTTNKKAQSYGEAWRACASFIGHWQIRGFGFFSVFERDTGNWVGRVGPWEPGGWPALEVGWAICEAAQGKGYAPEATLATIDWVFERYRNLPRIISLIDPDNKNSQAVARKIGEQMSGQTHDFAGIKLDIWELPRPA